MTPLLLALAALAADPLPEVWREAAPTTDGTVQPAPRSEAGFSLLALYQARAVTTNVVTTNPFLDGQVIGVLGGSNGTAVYDPETPDLDGDGEPDKDLGNATAVEQRVGAFLGWRPQALDGRAGLYAAFEVDFLYGDQAYGVGGNTGGGFGGDQVNLQTRRMFASFAPNVGPRHAIDAVAGLQFVADGAYNPNGAALDDLLRAGGGLRFFGSEAAGVSVFGRLSDSSGERLRYRLGRYVLAENGAALADDVALTMADAQWHPTWNARLGAHAWWLRDDSGGAGGIAGYGPTSALSALQGGPALDYRINPDDPAPEIDADLLWLALDAGVNHRLDQGKLGFGGLVAANLGRFYLTDLLDIPVRGWLASAEARYRYAPGAGSVLRAEALVDSRDGTDREIYTGVVTGNSYGAVGALWSTHGALLLFPDPGAINRQVAVVYDVSNGGNGLLGLSASAGYDLSPNRVNVTLGAAHARSPQAGLAASELNARLNLTPWPLWRLSAAGAVVAGLDPKPWTALAHVEWLAF